MHVQVQMALTGLAVVLPFLKAAVLLDQAFHKAQAPGYMLVAYPMQSQRPWSGSTLPTGARWAAAVDFYAWMHSFTLDVTMFCGLIGYSVHDIWHCIG